MLAADHNSSHQGGTKSKAHIARNHSSNHLIRNKSRTNVTEISHTSATAHPRRKSADDGPSQVAGPSKSQKQQILEAAGLGFTTANAKVHQQNHHHHRRASSGNQLSTKRNASKQKLTDLQDERDMPPATDDSWVSESDQSVSNTPQPSPPSLESTMPNSARTESTTPPASAALSSTLTESNIPKRHNDQPFPSHSEEQASEDVEERIPSASAPVSPVHKSDKAAGKQPMRPPLYHRKTSTSSTLAPSVRSMSYFSRAPLTPGLKKSVTALNPKLDIEALGWGSHAPMPSPALQVSPTASEESESGQHRRHRSTASSVSTVPYQSDLTRRLREASLQVSPGSERRRTASATNLKEHASGYFDSLRNLASASSTSIAQMVTGGTATDQSNDKTGNAAESGPPAIASAFRKISPNAYVPQANPEAMRKGSLGPNQSSVGKNHSPLISKFVSPSSTERPWRAEFDSSKPLHRESQESPASSSRATGSSGGFSRTQQKLMMQRDAPFQATGNLPHIHPGSSEPCTLNHATLIPPQYPNTTPANLHISTNAEQVEPHLNGPAEKAQHQHTMRLWALAVVKEADRVDREHDFVRKYRNPMMESFERLREKQRQRARV